jgi:hypothetical protein
MFLRAKLMVGVAALLMFACVAMAGSASKADAAFEGWFCNYYNSAPFGQNGDRCGAPDGNYHNTIITGSGQQHSACVNAMDQYGNLWGSWICGPAGGPAGGTYGHQFRMARGIVRNNVTCCNNQLLGHQDWF